MECLEMAEKAPTLEIRDTYSKLAETWTKLAGERVDFIIPGKEDSNA